MRVAVLMSGGVDSTAACLLLKQQGYQVGGLTMINWDASIAEKASRAAAELGIPHEVIDLRDKFKDLVIDYFCRTYSEGRTPNPCVECNRWIKFGSLLELAQARGYDKVATGHYARVDYDQSTRRYRLKRGIDPVKDQSYFLYRLDQEQLSKILFPLGEMTKEQVKSLARDHGLAVAQEKESQEICFITGDYRDFLKSQDAVSLPGQIISRDGQILGRHQGLTRYTIGQRKGLGVNAGRPVFVVEIDAAHNQLVVDDEKYLFLDQFYAIDTNWIAIPDLLEPMTIEAKIRSAARPAAAAIFPHEKGKIRVKFEQPQRAVTPGQSVVFYQGDMVIGGGQIILG